MSTNNKAREIAEDYSSSLSDLTINSKPLINMLTMLADDNVDHAPVIVQAIENHLQKVRSEVKLPVLYLIDSIVKNVNGAYLKLFTENIVNTFCGVFEKVDEVTRASMWKLRQTWNDVFPAKKLYSLDVRVQSIDPAWPITAPEPVIASGSIHLNPRFLSMSPVSTTPIVAPVKVPPGEPVSVSEAAMRELLKKQKELLELQKQKIELELLQAKTSLEQQQRQLDEQAGSIKSEAVSSTTPILTASETTQGKPTPPIVSNQATKQVVKQFPAAAASLLKNAGTNNGPRIAPASSLLVASARPVSRDPRLKASGSEPTSMDTQSRLRQIAGLSNEVLTDSENSLAQTTALNTVLSDQVKQQFITKQAINMNKLSLNHMSGDVVTSNISNNDIPNASINNNNNNKILSNTNRDAVSHRTNQKKDPRSSSNSCGNINNSLKLSPSGDHGSSSSNTSSSPRGGGSEAKSKDTKSPSSRSSSSSNNDKSSASSKSSHRKVANKSRSKQSQMSFNKMSKMDRDSSPIRSKSREKDSDGSSSSSRTSPQSSSQSSKSRKKNAGKSRKRSPSPPYKIPRKSVDSKSSSSSSTIASGLTEEEQSGSLIVSPPHPPTFKDIRQNTRQRNYIRRNKDSGMLNLQCIGQNISNPHDSPEVLIEAASKDEDLRAGLPVPAKLAVQSVEKKEDLDLRVLQPSNNNKRPSDQPDSTNKKTKAEKFDAKLNSFSSLFGNEDVDLRTLTHPKAGRPPTPPPPVISGEDNKTSWAKIKTPTKSDRDKIINNDDKRDRDRNKDRLGRIRLYNNKPLDDLKDRRRPFGNDEDSRLGRRNRELDKLDRNSDRNIEIIMKQAEEQLKQGSITKADYHTLIQEVWQMNEDQKLRAAQRKEKEIGSIVWEKGIDIGGFNPNDCDIGRGKDHPHGRNGPRWQAQPWQQHGPWVHPPGPSFPSHFNADFRPIGPWQNPRQFGPIRPDFNQFHGFNSGIGAGPRLGPGLLGPMGPNGPIMPGMIPNGPMGPMGLPNTAMTNMNGPPSLLLNGPHQTHNNILSHAPPPTRNISPNSVLKFDMNDTQNFDDKNGKEQGILNRELPQPDPKLLEEITSDTMKSINIDGIPREIRYYGQTGVVFMSWDDPREIGFQNGVRRILIDDKDTIICAFNGPYKEFIYEGEIHKIKLGAPTRELYVDDKWYECYFGGPPIKVDMGNKKVNVKLEGPPPQVKIGTVKRTDLVIAKINLIINARNMVPVFLDAKPQMFEIDGQPQTLEFTDALGTVLLNGRPFKVEFGGLPKPIIVGDKKHFIRFSVLPRGVQAGLVKIAGMKGETPVDSLTKVPTTDVKSTSDRTTPPQRVTTPEQDATSQDASDVSSSKPDLQLDMLSSVLSSAMAPASGLSYQAEPAEKSAATSTPAPILPANLNLNELFQRLVETGIVPRPTSSTAETKKPEGETEEEKEVKKEPEVIPVCFDKPETLKIKQPAIATALYCGMQCSSCGARFAPELATRYSHHLDWHFRQNRRERDPTRKAHSRPWYYDIPDWIQFEEIEDLEDRAQNWFETEKQTLETETANGDESPQETIQPSVPTGSDEDAVCQVCHDAFEQFYNEEKEEWHLRPAVSFENKNYHPLCLEDHKRALEKSAATLDDSLVEGEEEKKDDDETEESVSKNENEEADENKDEEMKEIKEEEQKEKLDEVEEIVEGIVEENIEDVKIDEEMKTDDIKENEEQKEPMNDDKAEQMEGVVEEKEENSSEVKIDDMEIENISEIKIKEEPIDVTEEFESEINWENVEIKTEPEDPEPEPEESIVIDVAAVVDTTVIAVKSSIDGNVELDTTPAPIPAAPPRIKINITKPIITNKDTEEAKEKVTSTTVETPTEIKDTPLFPASIKPTLQGRKLSVLPPVEKGHEMSGLCSIM
ncbi:uncharacterized protein Pcf11 isoform X2 [Chelonus insularis]|uniref:uncharacterized protein Pcf11 isoform X2 n=1 Tax=Chelonus insularis TaxID=460826 RepID=UPI00158D58FC|nr:uncharacterized protein LOC118066341 isoform X2 [Chelonus insularis]